MTSLDFLCIVCRKPLHLLVENLDRAQLLLLKSYRERNTDKRVDFSTTSSCSDETYDALRCQANNIGVSVCEKHSKHYTCVSPCAVDYLASTMTPACPICRGPLNDAASTIFDACYNKRLIQGLKKHLTIARAQFGDCVDSECQKLANRICQKDLACLEKSSAKKDACNNNKTILSATSKNQHFVVQVDVDETHITWKRTENNAKISNQMRVSWPIEITDLDVQILCRNMLAFHVEGNLGGGVQREAKKGEIVLPFSLVQMLCRVSKRKLLQDVEFMMRVPPDFELLAVCQTIEHSN